MLIPPKHFFIVGAQRSGTTYLYRLLYDHPEIEMAHPERPEPKFFLIDRLYARGLDYYYAEFFPQGGTGKLLGEKSTSYIESEKSAMRIVQHFPDAKIVMVLRNPVERAVSNYWFSFNNGFEKLSLEDAIYQEEQRRENYDHEQISASPYAYLKRGRYIDYIEGYEKHVAPANIKVLIYEQLTEESSALADLFEFLGVSPDFAPSVQSDQRVNASDREPVKISSDLQRYMQDYFSESNQCLAVRLNLDLERWWSGAKGQ